MVYLATTSGHLLLEYQKEVIVIKKPTVLAVTPGIQVT